MRLGDYPYWPKFDLARVYICATCEVPVEEDSIGMRPGDGPVVCRTCAAEEWEAYRAEVNNTAADESTPAAGTTGA